ncbi:hypothetical protein C0992_001395 [Termitomyces sp. T32_za158]|nr:hypothetical protein C0992_001395 [Termitomyces sp. T32_za158]
MTIVRRTFVVLYNARTMSSAINASGLLPTESKALEERPIQSHEQKIINAIKEMYSCSPKEDTFKIYAEDAVFHDPVGIAKGPQSIRAQFIGLTKIFPRADIPKFRLLKNPSNLPKDTILIDQDVAYFRDPKSSSPTKTLNSLLTIKLNESNLVTRHEEQWNHEKSTTGEDGFFGLLNEHRKLLTAKLTDAFVGRSKV